MGVQELKIWKKEGKMESAGSPSQNFKKGYEVLLQTLYEGYFKSFVEKIGKDGKRRFHESKF